MSARKKAKPAPAEGTHEHYREMCVPHETRGAADAAVAAFMEDVRAARTKHRIRDVCVVMGTSALSDEIETRWMSMSTAGNVWECAVLLAQAHGQCQERLKDDLAKRVTFGRSLERDA